MEKNQPKSAVLAGGGYIGLELAENLRELGLDVTIVQRPKQLMNPLDGDMAAFVHAKMRSRGVKLMLGHTVEGFEKGEKGTRVLLKDEQPLEADMVILAIGCCAGFSPCKRGGTGAWYQRKHCGKRSYGNLSAGYFCSRRCCGSKALHYRRKSSDIPCRSGK